MATADTAASCLTATCSGWPQRVPSWSVCGVAQAAVVLLLHAGACAAAAAACRPVLTFANSLKTSLCRGSCRQAAADEVTREGDQGSSEGKEAGREGGKGGGVSCKQSPVEVPNQDRHPWIVLCWSTCLNGSCLEVSLHYLFAARIEVYGC